MKLYDRRILSLAYASVLIACALAYLLAAVTPAHAAPGRSATKAYTPFDEPIPKVPKEIIADKRLDQKVKVFCKNRCLKDMFADLNAKTGVKVTTAKEVSSQRAIIYFHSRPLRDVMTEVSGIYGFHWLISGKPGAYEYQLFEDTVRAKRRVQVTEDLKADQDALLLDFTERILSPGPDADKALASLDQTNPDAYKAMSSSTQKGMMNMFSEFGISFLSSVLTNGTGMSRCGDLPFAAQTAICDWYNTMHPGSMVAKMVTGPDGQPQVQVTPPDPQQAPPPASPGDLADATIIMNRVATDATSLPRFQLIFKRQSGANGIQSLSTEWPVRSVTADDLRAADDLPVAQKVLSDTELPDDPKITVDKQRWLPYRKGLLLGDLLEAIAVQSGRDVIADYYLQDKTSDVVKAQTLKKTAEMMCKQFEYTCQVDAKTVRFRDNKWYTRNMYAEPPAQVLDVLWSKIETNGALSVRDLLPITALAADQTEWPGWVFVPGADTACQWPNTVRMWASLSEAEEKTARNGGLAVSQLSDDQRRKLDDMVAERKYPVPPDGFDRARIAMDTIRPEILSAPGVGKVISFNSSSSHNVSGTTGVPAIQPGQGTSGAGRVTTSWSGSPGAGAVGAIGGLASSKNIGDPTTWMARLGGSQNENLQLVVPDGAPSMPITLQMPKPVSDAERKEIASQRKADKDAEKTEVLQ